MLTTNDDAIAARLNILRSHGMTSLTWDRHKGHAWSYDVTEVGYNYRIDEIRSALGRVQLKKVMANNAKRKELTNLYREYLSELAPDVVMPFASAIGDSAHHILPILLPTGTNRQLIMEAMKKQGIQTSMHYPPIHKFKSFLYSGQNTNNLKLTEDISRREVTLPLYPTLKHEDVGNVVEALVKALSENE
jgi:dTDP-4-amino-4,6-dideoxygalactose transaminase